MFDIETLIAPLVSEANTAIAAFDASRVTQSAARVSFASSVMLAGVALACADPTLTGSQVATKLGSLVIAGNSKSTLNSYRSALSWYLNEGSNLATLRADCSRPTAMMPAAFAACVRKIAERAGNIWDAYKSAKKAEKDATETAAAAEEARKSPPIEVNPVFRAATNAKAAIAFLIESGAFDTVAEIVKAAKADATKAVKVAAKEALKLAA